MRTSRAKAFAVIAFVGSIMLVGPAAPAEATHLVQVDATQLTQTQFQLSGPVTVRRDANVVQSIDLPEGTYLLFVGSGNVASCPGNFRITATGLWSFDAGCDAWASGRGTPVLTLLGFDVHLDATQLSGSGVFVSMFGSPLVSTGAVQTQRLLPASLYGLVVGSGNTCTCHFGVRPDGAIAYGREFEAFLGGAGTDTIRFEGYDIAHDATMLSGSAVFMVHVNGAPAVSTAAVQSLRLLPATGYGLVVGSGNVCTCSFRVTTAGTVDYQSAFDAVLGGRGTSTIVFIGSEIEIDATALGQGQLQIAGSTVGTLDRSVVQSLRLLPATAYRFSGGGIVFRWTLTLGGTVNFDPSLEPCIGGRGTSRLTVGCDPFAVVVPLDVKPGSDANVVNLSSRGVVPVAILSARAFDATTVDVASVCFGDAEDPSERACTEAHGTGHLEDVDGDGTTDLVLHFRQRETGIDYGDAQACFHGVLADGTSVTGCDQIITTNADLL